eukprot:4800307-Pyramimonas_sp.AAC.1
MQGVHVIHLPTREGVIPIIGGESIAHMAAAGGYRQSSSPVRVNLSRPQRRGAHILDTTRGTPAEIPSSGVLWAQYIIWANKHVGWQDVPVAY